MWIALAVALLCSVPLLALGQLSSGDSSYLLRLEHVKEGEDICVLLQSDGNYHFERVLSDKALVYEGSVSRTSLQEVKTAVSSDEMLHLDQDRIPAPVVSLSYDELDLDIARVEGWQRLRFPDSDSRKAFHQSLDPLLKWVDSLPGEGRVQLSEDEGKNNCLPRRREDVHLARRQETASPVPAGASPSTVPSPYMLRILLDRLGPGEARRTCAIVYPNGFYHLEKSSQTYYVGGVYQPEVINAGLGGRIKADVFEQFLDPRATKELRKLLDNPELVVSRHSSMPIGIHYSDAEITFVFIPREDRLQQLTFSNYFGADNPQTHMSAGGHATRHVDSAAGLLGPLQKWLRSNIESRKAARLKEAYGNNCTASSALALPSEASSELAQIVPSDFDSSFAGASKPIPSKSRPDGSSTDASPIVAEDSANRGPTANEPAISLRVTTRMALVDVVATDKNGTPIADFRPTDLKVLEDGRPQSIKFFSHASSNSMRPGENRPPQLPPDVYSNRPQYRPATGPLVLVLLDGLNTASTDQAYARRQMLSYLRTLKPGQSVAVFALGTDLLLLQDFTSAPQVLIAALEKYSSNDSLLLARGMPAMITPPNGRCDEHRQYGAVPVTKSDPIQPGECSQCDR